MIVAHAWKARPSVIFTQWTRWEIVLAAAHLKWRATKEQPPEGSEPPDPDD